MRNLSRLTLRRLQNVHAVPGFRLREGEDRTVSDDDPCTDIVDTMCLASVDRRETHGHARRAR